MPRSDLPDPDRSVRLHRCTAAGPPPSATAAAVLAFVCAVPVLLLTAVVWTLTGLEGRGAAQLWAAVPLAVAGALVTGGVRLLRRRGAAVLVAANVPLVVAGLLQSGVLALSGSVPGGVPLALLVLPASGTCLVLTPGVRRWLAGAPPRGGPAPSARPPG